MHWAHIVCASYDWLYAQGLWKAVIGSVVALALAWVVRVGHRLRKIEDHLNTSTPGGLGDVVSAIREAGGPDDMG